MTEIATANTKESQLSKELERFVGTAIDLMKEKRFHEAIKHLRNREMARRMGFGFDGGRTMFFNRTPTQAEIEDAINFVGNESIFRYDPLKVKLANVEGLVVEGGDVREIELPQVIYRNVALIHAEEWLHGLQYLRKGSIAGIPDHEIDVAAYIHGKGVPLTQMYLNSHGRNAYQFLKENPSLA